jgi:arsenite methyltransferase
MLDTDLKSKRRPDYGIDAPGLVRIFFTGGLIVALLFLTIILFVGVSVLWLVILATVLAILSFYLLGMGCFMAYESKVTKLKDRDAILGKIVWRGDETVLDIGCGRGLMLIGAAKRLRTGKAFGVDLWLSRDQSANSPEATLDNARIEKVDDRVEVQTADMRKLPFADAMFDVITSYWVVHNVEKAEDRHLAITQMLRVLKPGGVLILADIEHRHDYVDIMSNLGLIDISLEVKPVKDLIVKAISFGSFAPFVITARKPAA